MQPRSISAPHQHGSVGAPIPRAAGSDPLSASRHPDLLAAAGGVAVVAARSAPAPRAPAVRHPRRPQSTRIRGGIRYALALLLVCLGFAAQAPDQRFSPRYYACMGTTDGTTAVARDCIADETSRQDARLNETYRHLVAQLSGNRRNEVVDAQRLWIPYRNANCRIYAYPDDGGEIMAEIHAAACTLRMTAQRADELESLLSE